MSVHGIRSGSVWAAAAAPVVADLPSGVSRTPHAASATTPARPVT